MAMKIETPEQLQQFLQERDNKLQLEKSAIMEGYELAKAKLARAQQEYTALAQMHNQVVEENKRLKKELADAKETKPVKRAKKK